MLLILGATGRVGREVVGQALDAGLAVRAAARTAPEAGFPAAVDVVRVDLEEPGSLTPHLGGIAAALLIWPFTSPDQRVVATLARAVPRIVYVSAAAAADDRDSFWAQVERAIERDAHEWTMLRPTGFAANTLAWADQVRSGSTVRWPFGAARRSLIDEADIAAVALRALTEPGHANERYVLTGPRSLTQTEQVEIIGAALGRGLDWMEQPRGEAEAMLTPVFGDAAFARTALETWSRFVEHPEPVTATVPELLGRPARTYEAWVAAHLDAFAGR